MKQIDTFYNNELLTGIAILAALKQKGKVEISKVLLIHPILSYKGIVEFLKDKRTKIRSVEELIIKKNMAFANFNKRYLEDLELSINAIFLFKELGMLDIINNELIYIEAGFDFKNKVLGKRALDIIDASYNLINVLDKEEASNLYLSLRVEL
ncbi:MULTISPECIES: hypothetical protein [Clostridiaceae]|uniref:Uncharacterized protein n=1 Tax=Clostridium manihotivorum TaxID=2320868 RepID=A0A410E0R4_9CLOT|nr:MULTISPECIES: hypothetical protein [Clostridiaceae]QAA34952.1 hypothetical protein C1I91_26755 [Clostridium manihotivorum]